MNIININSLNKLNELLNFSNDNSIFYSKRYFGKSLKISCYDDWMKIPFLNSEDFANQIPPVDMLTRSPEKAYTFTSGGSTGQPKIIYVSSEELEKNILHHGEGYKRAGIKKTDVVGTFGVPGYLSSEFTVYLGLEHTGCLIVPLGINTDPEKMLYYLQLLNVNALLVMPSDVIPLIHFLEQTKTQLNIEKIIYGGEKLYETTKKYIQNALNVKHFGSVFQSMDVGTIGYKCEYCNDDEYHLNEIIQFAEILNDKNELVGYDEIGNLVLTNLNRRLMPVIRYKTNDLVVPLSRSCSCKDNSLKFRLVGRKADFIKIGGEQFKFNIIERVLSEIEGITGIYQIEVYKKNGLDSLHIKIEERNIRSVKNKDLVLEDILERFLERSFKLKDLHEKGIINPIELSFVTREHLLTSKSSGKVIKLIDDRN
ncbi:phenylacetate--CoA ligase family protein [Alkalihalobacillus sp. FSL R5-0424]